jgi:hypothetical protein
MTATQSAQRDPAEAANDSGIDTPSRAEYPPAHYWRRWSNDAPAASAPEPAAPPAAAADTPADGTTATATPASSS